MIRKSSGEPKQIKPFTLSCGVTVIVETCAELAVLVAVKELMFPFPLEGKPIRLLSFTH